MIELRREIRFERSTAEADCRVSSASNTATGLVPGKGSVPVAISYSTTPNEKRSVRPSMSPPRACSGDMYATVPSVVPSVVTRSSTPRVLASAPRRCGHRGFRHRELGEAEVEHLRLAPPRDENIRRLDVAMHDAAGVRSLERVGDFQAEIEHALERQRARRDLVLQRLAVEQLHHDEVLAVVLADVVDRADVRMVQRRGDARLAPEAFERLGVRGQIARQELQRDLTAEPDVFRAVDDAHAAAADAFENPVMTDSGADHFYCAAMLSRLIQLSIKSHSQFACSTTRKLCNQRRISSGGLTATKAR